MLEIHTHPPLPFMLSKVSMHKFKILEAIREQLYQHSYTKHAFNNLYFVYICIRFGTEVPYT